MASLCVLCGRTGQLSDELSKARRQLDEARSDNVALYEKVGSCPRQPASQCQVGYGKRLRQGWGHLWVVPMYALHNLYMLYVCMVLRRCGTWSATASAWRAPLRAAASRQSCAWTTPALRR